jgi:drug/metabolite transporter (DMT)-like permease
MALILCILTNVIVGILFKFFGRWKVDNFQAILGNYITCLTITSFVVGNISFHSENVGQPWFIYAFIMGAIFVTSFNINAKTIAIHGVGLTTTAMKLSLILPVLTSLFYFGEVITWQKLLGIALTIVAIYLIAFKKEAKNISSPSWYAILPLLTWLGSSFVDESLYLVEQTNISNGAGLKFTSSVFLSAGFVGLSFFLFLLIRGKVSFELKSWLAGIFLLGIPNFYSIYLVIVVLEEGLDASVVFPILNISVILLSTIIGKLFFKESLDRNAIIGMCFSVIAIILLSVKI